MTVVFDAEVLLAFSFDEPGAEVVEGWLERVYDGEIEGYVTTINLAEFRYVAIRRTSVAEADAHLDALRNAGLTEYSIDDHWEAASSLKADHNPSIADAYAVAAAKHLDDAGRTVTLLVGDDADFDVFEDLDGYGHLIDRVRDEAS